MSDDLVVLLVM